ncbi:MAG: Ycf66 family protein [Synechococcaceae cyanobacterium]|nr:Ycf66 family protein [Synechococcaceae cyanobacterium]
MLATLGGLLALLLGLAILLLPLLATELSRPRDSAWGAVVLLLGLVLVTSADRLTGAPMLGVLCGGLLIGRLAAEVSQGRWRQLSPEEQQRLWSAERWQTSLQQAGASLAQLLAVAGTAGSGLGQWLAERRQPKSTGKRWVRPEDSSPEAALPETARSETALPETHPPATAVPAPTVPVEAELKNAVPEGAAPDAPAPADTVVVSSFAEIDALLEAELPKTEAPAPEGAEPGAASSQAG